MSGTEDATDRSAKSEQNAPPFAVLIIGGGPVGLSLGMDLASRGIDTLILEQRAAMEPPEPRCNHVSARTMEVFRRLGVADPVRAAGLPADYPHDVAYVTSMSGHELGRVRIPSRANRFNDAGYADGGWPTPEPPHRINQVYLEPVLFRHATTFDKLTIVSNFRAHTVTQLGASVQVGGTDLSTGKTRQFEAQFVAGCDGASSLVRKILGVELQGDDGLMYAMMATINAPALLRNVGCNPAWMYWILNPLQLGAVIALDGADEWVVNGFYSSPQDAATFDWNATIRRCIGSDVDFTIHTKKPWVGRRLLADKFSVGNVFLLGDAAHNWIPMAGYGMNAGIADAANLAWKLAAVINGWADRDLLPTFEAERRPILDQVSSIAALVRKKNNLTIAPDVEEPGPAGDACRAQLGSYMVENDGPQFACIGLNFGYYYEGSPAIAYDGGQPPAYAIGSYTPSTYPGCRVPHIWLNDKSSLYDHLGPGYTLLRCDSAIDVSVLQDAAQAAGVTLHQIDLHGQREASIYDTPLLLVRPDQHVAWRGMAVPTNVEQLIEQIRGNREYQNPSL